MQLLWCVSFSCNVMFLHTVHTEPNYTQGWHGTKIYYAPEILFHPGPQNQPVAYAELYSAIIFCEIVCDILNKYNCFWQIFHITIKKKGMGLISTFCLTYVIIMQGPIRPNIILFLVAWHIFPNIHALAKFAQTETLVIINWPLIGNYLEVRFQKIWAAMRMYSVK